MTLMKIEAARTVRGDKHLAAVKHAHPADDPLADGGGGFGGGSSSSGGYGGSSAGGTDTDPHLSTGTTSDPCGSDPQHYIYSQSAG